MNYNSYYITANLNGLSGTEVQNVKILNNPELIFNFNFIPYTGIDLVKMKITFDSKIRIFEFNEIPTNFTLRREKPFEYEANDIVIIKLFYSNFNTYEYQFPIIFSLPSILEGLDGASIQSAQFLDTIENDDLFFVMKNNKDQYFNFRSGSNVITYRKLLSEQDPATIAPTPIITALLSTATGYPPADLLTEFNEFIEVNT